MDNQIIRQAANAAPFQRIHLAIAASAMIFVISVESKFRWKREAGWESENHPHPTLTNKPPKQKKKNHLPFQHITLYIEFQRFQDIFLVFDIQT